MGKKKKRKITTKFTETNDKSYSHKFVDVKNFDKFFETHIDNDPSVISPDADTFHYITGFMHLPDSRIKHKKTEGADNKEANKDTPKNNTTSKENPKEDSKNAHKGMGYVYQNLRPMMWVQYPVLKEKLPELYAAKHSDTYIAANGFRSNTRNYDNLHTLRNFVIDIDCHGYKKYDEVFEANIKQLINDLQKFFQENDLLIPNHIVCTGRGIQLWYALKPIPASRKNVGIYKSVIEKLVDKFNAIIADLMESGKYEYTNFSVDRASSCNAAGIFRAPGSYNTKVRKWTTIEHFHSYPYDLHQLANIIKHNEKVATNGKIKEVDYDKFSEENKKMLLFVHGNQRVARLAKFVQVRDANIGNENRHFICLYIYSALVSMTGLSDDIAFKLTNELNNKMFKMPLRERELLIALGTAKKKGGYKFTNKKIIEDLQMTPEEQTACGIFAAGEKEYSDCRPNATRDDLVTGKRALRAERIMKAHNEGKSITQIAKETKHSKNTVSKVIKEFKDDVIDIDVKSRTFWEELFKKVLTLKCHYTETKTTIGGTEVTTRTVKENLDPVSIVEIYASICSKLLDIKTFTDWVKKEYDKFLKTSPAILRCRGVT